jgi:transposase
VGRAIGLDVHRDFCVVAICEDGVVRSAGRVPSTPEGLGLLAESLLVSDRVALEVTGSCWEVARILEPHVDRVVVVSPDDTGISSARAKTDKLDARTLAGLLLKGELDAVWMPDERCQVLRRRLARREQLIRGWTRAKNEIQAVLARRLRSDSRDASSGGVAAGGPSKRRSGHPCPDRRSECGRCGARLLLHWLGANLVPERALVIERDGGRRHQLVIASRL